ncbi:MAG: diguanylate cyclase [Oceanospirillales bacterium]|nr:diguanylate cyclase [Oceanospirillales bacterium]MBR9889156.1 diguanylate cyclase [Oceanospirillales bacterium]
MAFKSADWYRYKTFIEQMNDAILVENERREISLVNQAFCDLFNLPVSPGSLIGTDCSDSAHHVKHLFVDSYAFVNRIEEILAKKLPVEREYLEMVCGKHLERDFIPIYDQNTYVGLVWLYKDLSSHYLMEEQLRDTSRQLHEQSITDSLTGIGNRRYVDNELLKYFDHSKRHSKPLSIAMLDVDFFKQVNDDYGHVAGDEVLVHLSNYLQNSLRSSDLLGRMGGEEFLIALPETTLVDAEHKMSALLAGYTSPNCIDRPVTFSAGLACASNHADLKGVLLSADMALYAAKKAGRYRVVVES